MCPCQRRCVFNAGCNCCFVVQKKDIFRSRRMKQHWDCFWKMWEIGRRWVMYICSCFKFCLQIMLITVAHPTSSSFLCFIVFNLTEGDICSRDGERVGWPSRGLHRGFWLVIYRSSSLFCHCHYNHRYVIISRSSFEMSRRNMWYICV